MDQRFLYRNRNINRGFRKLNIWKLAIELYQTIHPMMHSCDIPFKIRGQIQDSALSVSSNIAEGYARRSIKETLRFYEIALSSAAECYSQLYALTAAKQINENTFKELDTQLYELENKLIAMNKKLIKQIKDRTDWQTEY